MMYFCTHKVSILKPFIFIFALFMLLKPAVPFLEYAVLYDYIKTELCVNVDKPELKCNGKCHLKKELSQASDTENKTQKNSASSMEYQVLYFQDFGTEPIFVTIKQSVKVLFSYNKTYVFRFMNAIFHPPLI